MNLDFFNDLINKAKENDFVQNFTKELGKFIENNSNLNLENKTNKYGEYWKDRKFMEDEVSSTIGISRWANDITYHKELGQAIDESILELAEKEGTLYRKQFRANGSKNGEIYKIEKYENGKIEKINVPVSEIPSKYKNEDILFQYEENGEINVRQDLKEKAVNLASEKCEEFKVKEDRKAEDYKIEGHTYNAFEDDGYIFLKDLTEEKNYSIEDIDFIVDCYDGEGKYQVINGEYKKIQD